MKKLFLSYGKQSIDNYDIKAVVNALKSDLLTQGDIVPQFESAFAKYCGSKFCVLISSGTAALHLAYLAVGLKNGDEVITSPITFAATANAALYLEAKVKFVDIDSKTAAIDIEQIETAITNKTKVIAPIDYAGIPLDIKKIHKVAKKHNLFIIEDACHALGAKTGYSTVGDCKYSDMTVFSFHPVKHITSGEGGAITTNNEKFYKKLLALRTHGIVRDNFKYKPTSPVYHEMQLLGLNYRITDFQAALAISQLSKVDSFIEKRVKIAKYYDSRFYGCNKITLLTSQKKSVNSYHLYPIILPNKKIRDELYYKLLENGVKTQIHYIPVYKHPYYQENGYKSVRCKFAENYYETTLSIPIYPLLKMSEAKFVADIILGFL